MPSDTLLGLAGRAGGHRLKTDWGAFSDSATYRNHQFPSASASTMGQLANLQRKEYYSKGRYLRSSSRPELGEDIEDDEQDCERLGWTARGGQPGQGGREDGTNSLLGAPALISCYFQVLQV